MIYPKTVKGTRLLIGDDADAIQEMIDDRALSKMFRMSLKMVFDASCFTNFDSHRNTPRGSGYYRDVLGFEIEHDSLGAQKQVVGGGVYDGGVGFAIGVDRLSLVANADNGC